MNESLTILVIDDNKDDRTLCQRSLKEVFGDAMRVAEAASGESGLKTIEKYTPHCILLDYSLPGRNGIAVLKSIRAKYPHLPVIMLTGQGNEALAVQSMKEGAQDYIVKSSITPETLQRVVRTAIEHEALQKSIHEQRASLEILATIIESSEDAIISKNLEGVIFSWNKGAERLFGYSAAEAIGQNISLIPPDRPDEERHILSQIKAGKRLSRFETPCMKKNGQLVDVSFTVSPIYDANGTVIGASKILRDISDRREGEKIREQLRQSQKMEALGQLTGGIAHDFNNLLAIVLGNLDLITEQTKEDDPLRAFIKPSIEAIEHGAALTKQLLAFGRKQTLQPKIISLNKLLHNFTVLVQHTLGERVEVMLALEPDLWNISVDPNQLQGALLNLAVNARDAMPGGGKLIFETHNVSLDEEYAKNTAEITPGDYVVLSVSDTGEGMTKEVMEKAFEPFFTTKDVGHGSGLGLSMIYGFVKQSNGNIKIYSELGYGTSIKIYLPRADGDALYIEQGKVKPVSTERKAALVLVVEDNPEVLKITVSMVDSLGYNVLHAATGDAAMEILQSRADIDLLLTDVMLPGTINGPVLAKRAVELHPTIKVLFNSGYTENAMLHGNILEKNVPIISKPFRKQQLADKIEEVLKK